MAEILTEDSLHKKTSQELTALLYEACADRLRQAIVSIENKRYIESNQLLKTCNDILYRLGAGLNYEAGIIADQLEALYNYMAELLIRANISKDTKPVKEALSLLESIASSWQVAQANSAGSSADKLHKRRASAYDMDLYNGIPNVNMRE